MADARDRTDEEAAAWLVRLRDAPAADWEAFTAWLEADPAHAAAYDLVALADAELDDLPLARPALVMMQAPRVSRRAVFGWGGAAIAAALVGAITLLPSADFYEVTTAAGERRIVALDDGSRIALNGDSRITLDRDNARYARVERGEALFTVIHDDARSFRVEAGEAELLDMGTIFNVVHDGERTEVGVSEGAVRWQRSGRRVDLSAGMALSQRGNAAPAITRSAPETIGGWREGRLSYSASRYDAVVADLARNLGTSVAIEGVGGERPFSGVIVVDRDAAVTMQRAGALLEMRARRAGTGWILTVENSAGR